MSPPTAEELQDDPVVKQAMEEAWRDSQPGDSARRHEEGGWIYRNSKTGETTIRRATPGGQAGIDLSHPPALRDSVVVGKYHTHPNPISEGWDPRPSDEDRAVDERHGVPDLIRAEDGIHVSGPASRRGGLGGGSGFPP